MVKIVKDIQYTLTSDGWVAESANDTDIYEVDIPAEIDGHPVVAIEFGAFEGLEKLETVWIPHTVTNIENRAFSDCINLKDVHSDSKDLMLGTDVFHNCRMLTTFETAGTVLLGWRAFSNCIRLHRFVGKIDSLQDRAFLKCYALKEPLFFADLLHHFYANALEGCSVSELHFEGDVPEFKKLGEDLTRFVWYGRANSNIMDLAYQGLTVKIEEN